MRGSEPVAAFVLHWNQPDACLRTITGLRAQSLPVRVTVVDNGSGEQLLARLRGAVPSDVRLVTLDANHGWGGAFNIVLREWLAGSGEYCVLSAHDALLSPDCLARLADALDSDPHLGMVCPEYGDRGVLRYTRLRGVHVRTVCAKPEGSVEYMPSPHGTVVMFRRSCLQSSGLFDERFFAYGDEAEIGLRAARHGWRIGMVWGARVMNPSTSTPSAVVAYLTARNGLLLTRLESGLAWAWLRLGLKLLAGVRGQHGTWRHKRVWRARVLGLLDFARGRFGPPPGRLT